MPCAAGNAQKGTTAYTANSHSPGCAREAMCCGAGDLSGGLADFSSWGTVVDVRAIGVAVESWGLRGSRSSLSGTSMATPYLTAGCCVVAGASNSEEARQALYKTATDTSLPPYKEGAGIYRADAALDSLFVERPPKPKLDPRFLLKKKWSAMQLRRMIERIVERSR